MRRIGERNANPPHYVGVGAEKSGSTWWHAMIRRHHEVEDAPKEFKHFVNVFGQESDSGLVASYLERFLDNSDRLQGEWTPRYMYDPWGIPMLSQVAPDTRIIAIMRDPWERAVSGYAHSARQRLANDVWMMNDAIHKSLYADQLERLFKYYDRDSVLLIQYEQAVAAPKPLLERTYAHIGCADVSYEPPNLDKRVNVTPGDKPMFPSAVRDAAREAFAAQAKRLIELIPNLDRSLWPSVF